MSSADPIKTALSQSFGKIYSSVSCGFYRLEHLSQKQPVKQDHKNTDVVGEFEEHLSDQSLSSRILSRKWQDVEWESQSELVFDLASLTKALFTAPKIFQIACEKGFSFYQPLESFLEPSLKSHLSPKLRQLTLASLLGHYSGLPAWANLWVDCESHGFLSYKEKLIFHLNRLGERINPDRGMVYSDIGYLLLGLIIESESKKSLQECLTEWNFQSSSGLSFSPTQKPCASTGFCTWRQRELVGEVHDENCSGLGGACGHAGLFGNLKDVSTHLKWLLSTGFGRAFLHHNALMRKDNDLRGDGLLGLRQGLAAHAQPFLRGKAIGHLGFTGTSFWIDPDNLSFYVLLTNRVVIGRLSKGIMDVRAEVSKFAEVYFSI